MKPSLKFVPIHPGQKVVGAGSWHRVRDQLRDSISVGANRDKDIRAGYENSNPTPRTGVLCGTGVLCAHDKAAHSTLPCSEATSAINPTRIVYVELTPMQRRFLNVAAEMEKGLLADLAAEVVPIVRKAIDDYRSVSSEFTLRGQSADRLVAEALLDWAKAYRLETRWVLSASYETVLDWARLQKKVPLRFEVSAWLTFGPVDTLQVLREMGRTLAKIRNGDGAFEQLEPRRETRTSRTRSKARKGKSKRFRPEHVDWLVRFQVQMWSYSEIAKYAKPGPRAPHGDDSGRTTVRNKIQELASAIDIPLRPSKVGRPRKSNPGSRSRK